MFKVRWKIVKQAAPYNPTSKRCNLCLWEKYFIICKPTLASLNKPNELISSFRCSQTNMLSKFLNLDISLQTFHCPTMNTHIQWWCIYNQPQHSQFKSACQHTFAFDNNNYYLMSGTHKLCCMKLNNNKNAKSNIFLICSTTTVLHSS